MSVWSKTTTKYLVNYEEQGSRGGRGYLRSTDTVSIIQDNPLYLKAQYLFFTQQTFGSKHYELKYFSENRNKYEVIAGIFTEISTE